MREGYTTFETGSEKQEQYREAIKMNVSAINNTERYSRIHNDLNTWCNVHCHTHSAVAQGHLMMMNMLQF